MYYVYFLKSKSLDWYYVGYTADIESRLNRHNSGLVKSTKGRIPFELVYKEEFEAKTDARKRELEIKKNWKLKKEIIESINFKALSSNG